MVVYILFYMVPTFIPSTKPNQKSLKTSASLASPAALIYGFETILQLEVILFNYSIY